MSRRAAALAALLLLPSLEASAAERRSLSIEERIDARRAIEKVLYEHRTWPEGTPYPKPSFEQWLPAGAIEREIEDDLRKSDALAKRWGHPVEPAALQAELDRMLRDSKAPDVLREILDALGVMGDEATLAAEVLARHTVVDRLARSAFAYDARIHGETYERAAAARDRVFDIAALRGAADRFVELRYERARDVKTLSPDLGAGIVERVDETTWRDVVEPLRARALGEMGALEESEHEFTVTAVTARGPGSLTVATAVWPKRSFDDWWEAERGAFSPDEPIGAPDAGYTIGVLTAPGNPCTNDTWYPLNRVVPGARMEAVSVWTGSEMIVWGGGAGITGALATGGRYRPDIDVWIEMNAANAPSARRRATAVWTGTEMIVWGGDDGGSPTTTAFNSGGRYNPATDTWTATDTSTAPAPRRWATSVWTGSAMIVWGGQDPAVGRIGTGGAYNPAANSWSATTNTDAPSARYGHTATWFNGEMIVWGGDTGLITDTGGRYNPGSNQWTATTLTNNPGARAWHSAVVMGGRILIWGGQRTSTNTWNTGAYYQSNHAWIAISSTNAPTGRMHHVAAVVLDPNTGDRRMVVFGGQDNLNGSSVNFYDIGDGRAYRELQNDWVAMNLSGAPSFRRHAAAASTGLRLIVWGGAAGNAALGDGRQYDPFNNVWSGVSDTGTAGTPPGARVRHTLVSTGSELVVWGGQQPSGAYATGGSSYSPATDSWTALSTAGSPSQVYQHTAVWTGSVMPVWGGETPGGTVNTGAYWDGFGWTAMASAGAPSVRRAHTAVWAPGVGMMVWGGTFGFLAGVRNDGGIYFHHPLFGDNWANTPPAAPIVGRIGHTATWAGNRMIVFGGLTLPLAVVGDGASFNPGNYTWSVLPTTNAPSPRYAHTAICPGDDSAIIWGGAPPLANGARYSVSANAWTPIAPVTLEARGQVESVWTGSEMIVWGGLGSAALGNGARYNPAFDAWTPMSATGAPSARYDYRSRFHGGEMYLWGGSDNTNTGARYCASCTPLESYEVARDLDFTSPTSLVWTASAGVSAYSLYRGTMTIPGTWVYDHGCYQSGLPGPSATEAVVPPDGTGYYYLVGATNGCSRTNLGQRTGGAMRPVPACP